MTTNIIGEKFKNKEGQNVEVVKDNVEKKPGKLYVEIKVNGKTSWTPKDTFNERYTPEKDYKPKEKQEPKVESEEKYTTKQEFKDFLKRRSGFLNHNI